MNLKPPFGESIPDADEQDEHVEFETNWNMSTGGFGYRQRVSGPRHLVDDLIAPDNPSLLRWGVFVVTFVPTVTTLIAKLPEIITALADAFGSGS